MGREPALKKRKLAQSQVAAQEQMNSLCELGGAAPSSPSTLHWPPRPKHASAARKSLELQGISEQMRPPKESTAAVDRGRLVEAPPARHSAFPFIGRVCVAIQV